MSLNRRARHFGAEQVADMTTMVTAEGLGVDWQR